MPRREPPVLVYQATKREFMDDVETDAITTRITQAFEHRVHRAAPREVRSWNNSMQYMYKVLNTTGIPGRCTPNGLPKRSALPRRSGR